MGKIYSKLFIDVQDVKILSDLAVDGVSSRSRWTGVCECCRDWGHRGEPCPLPPLMLIIS